nr:transposase [uncultured Flavobacterium sp.]
MYLYGYLNVVRSGRDLEKECLRNMEMQWLLEDNRPNYHSISDFRKNNPIASKNTFKLFVSFLKEADLIGCETIAIDGFLVVAQTQFPVKTNFTGKGFYDRK